jgi:hypothetical protein
MQIDISFARMEVYECGAMLLALLACPNESEEGKRAELYLSLCGRALWSRYSAAPDDWTPITVRPQHVFRHPDQIDADVGFVGKRFSERMVAARMAVKFFERAGAGSVTVPKDIKRLSINEMANYVLADAELKDPEYLEKRIWRPSRPVIHLATAAAIIGQASQRAGQGIQPESYLSRSDLIEDLVNRAEIFALLAEHDAQFPVEADQLIRIRLT